MRKILVVICLMLISSSAFSFSVELYREWKEEAYENEFVESGLNDRISSIYQGLLALKIVSQTNTKHYGTTANFELWCSPGELHLNYENLTNIIDRELVRKGNYPESFAIAFILYYGLVHTFPCE